MRTRPVVSIARNSIEGIAAGMVAAIVFQWAKDAHSLIGVALGIAYAFHAVLSFVLVAHARYYGEDRKR